MIEEHGHFFSKLVSSLAAPFLLVIMISLSSSCQEPRWSINNKEDTMGELLQGSFKRSSNATRKMMGKTHAQEGSPLSIRDH